MKLCLLEACIIITRISGMRTAPFPRFLIPHRVPHGVYPKILVLPSSEPPQECDGCTPASVTLDSWW